LSQRRTQPRLDSTSEATASMAGIMGRMPKTGPLAQEVAQSLGAVLYGQDQQITGVAPLNAAKRGALSFVLDPDKHSDAVAAAIVEGAVLLFPTGHPVPELGEATAIAVENPRAAFAAVTRDYFVPPVPAGIAATAVIDDTAIVASSAHVGQFTVIGPDVVIGENVEIRNHVVIAADVRIGHGSLIKSHAVIGEEGLGIDKDPAGNNIRLPHLGSVVLGDFTEVGSFTTVCSGTIVPTVVGNYTKIDDHVHIAHNVQIGRNVIVTANAEIAGSVVIGDEAWIGPNSTVLQGLAIGARALVGIGAVITKSVGDDEVHFGNPARRVPPSPPTAQ